MYTGPAGTPRQRAALDGPVELEAPLGELERGSGRERKEEDAGVARSALHSTGPPALGGPKPGLEQHQQAEDEADGSSRPKSQQGDGKGGLAPLPRRRPRTPVLVADHGRTVASPETADEPETDETEERTEPHAHRDRPDSTADTGSGAERTDTTAPSATVAGLPRRVRQANLAPQLKQDSAHSTTGRGQSAGSEDLANRDAEEVRSRMASLQRGWQRGRLQNAGASGDEAAESAPRTKPEGDGR